MIKNEAMMDSPRSRAHTLNTPFCAAGAGAAVTGGKAEEFSSAAAGMDLASSSVIFKFLRGHRRATQTVRAKQRTSALRLWELTLRLRHRHPVIVIMRRCQSRQLVLLQFQGILQDHLDRRPGFNNNVIAATE